MVNMILVYFSPPQPDLSMLVLKKKERFPDLLLPEKGKAVVIRTYWC